MYLTAQPPERLKLLVLQNLSVFHCDNSPCNLAQAVSVSSCFSGEGATTFVDDVVAHIWLAYKWFAQSGINVAKKNLQAPPCCVMLACCVGARAPKEPG